MKKAAAAAVVLTGVILAGGIAVKSGSLGELVIASVRTEDETEQSSEETAVQIDTSVPVLPGSRIAVVSKCVSGEFWDMVHQGMDAAVKDINEAYGCLLYTSPSPRD